VIDVGLGLSPMAWTQVPRVTQSGERNFYSLDKGTPPKSSCKKDLLYPTNN